MRYFVIAGMALGIAGLRPGFAESVSIHETVMVEHKCPAGYYHGNKRHRCYRRRTRGSH